MKTTLTQSESFLRRKGVFGLTPAILILAAIMLLSAGLHFYDIDALGDANTYYTAGVESMLQSWHNFFFVAAEPGGSVTIDKPPLGLWIEAAFAYAFGVSGLAVSLPNILAGIFSIPLLYSLVRKYLGEAAGLLAGLVLAVTPVAVAVDRNNTMDGMLVFTLLLAAWAFIKATETGRSRWLFLGTFIVGLGFNIKMLQAFLPLPAFFALYFFGARESWGRKVVNLGVASVVLIVVSLSWAVVVDLTPEDQRPYIGSSQDNTVMELIVGHNGLNRLLGGRWNQQTPEQAFQNRSPDEGPGQQFPQQNIQPPQARPGGGDQPLAGGPAPGLPPPGSQAGPYPPTPPQGGGTGAAFQHETGSPSLLRFFQVPLGKEMSWLLPFALIGVLLLTGASRPRLPLASGEHKALVLWGGWMLTCLVFFSSAEFFHAYYMIMLAPALGAMVGGGFVIFWNWSRQNWWAGGLFALAVAATITFQVYLAWQVQPGSVWTLAGFGLLAAGLVFLGISALSGGRTGLLRLGFATLLAAVLLVPGVWTGLTVTDDDPNINLPAAYAGEQPGRPGPAGGGQPQANAALLDYLLANTQDTEYLLAVPNAFSGAKLIIETGRPVLYMGGFSGNDPVVDAADLAAMVAEGKLRFILYGGERGGDRVITDWLTATCRAVPRFNQSGSQSQPRPQPDPIPLGGPQSPPGGGMTLYRCGG